jgi:hypothetical protein
VCFSWNPSIFLYLPLNGSERNSERFLFRKTDGIPTEGNKISFCFVFGGNFFFRKLATVHSTTGLKNGIIMSGDGDIQ